MIKNVMCALLLLAMCLNLNAQATVGPITITHGKEIIEDDEKIVRISAELDGKIYTLANRKKKYYIKVFESAEMGLVSTNEIELPDFKGKDIDFEDLAVIADRIYVLGSIYDRKEKISNLFGIEVGRDGKLTKNKKKLFSTKVTKRREQGAFYFKDSPTGDRFLIMHATQFNKEDVIQYEIKLLDPNLDVAMEHLEKVPYNDRRGLEFTIADFDVSLNDDVFLVINESFRDRKTMTNNEKFQLHAFKASNGYKKEVIDIKFTDKEIINCEMLATGSGKLHLAGFYSGVRKNGKAKKDLRGVYSSIIDVSSNEVEQLKFNEFDYDTKVKLIGERRAKKGKDVKPYYLTHSLVEKDDGGLILLSEYQLVVEGNTSGIGPLAFTAITYINNEIIVTSLAKDGSVEWSNVIPKKQRASFTVLSLGLFGFSGNGNFTVAGGIMVPLSVMGKGPEYLSAMPIYENGQLTVVFNDNPKNYGVTDIDDIKWLGNYNKAVPVAVMFDDKGNMTRVDQDDVVKHQLILRPRVHFRKTEKEYIIYSSRKSKDKMGRMIIN